MDIRKIAEQSANEENGVPVPIFDKLTDEPFKAADGSAVTITVVGSESKRYRRAQDAQTREAISSRRRKMSPDDLRENRIALASAAVIGWQGWESVDDETKVVTPIECSPENVKALLSSSQDILQQVEEGIEKHARFFANSSKS